MRRFSMGLAVYLIAAGLGAAALLAARHASHRFVADVINGDPQSSLNAYVLLHPGAWTDVAEPLQVTLAEVRDHLAEINEHLRFDRPTPLLFPVAQVVGLMEVPTILMASLALGLIPWLRSQRQDGGERPQPSPLARLD